MGGERAEIQFQIRDIGEACHCFCPEDAGIFPQLHHNFLTQRSALCAAFSLSSVAASAVAATISVVIIITITVAAADFLAHSAMASKLNLQSCN
jgi:hypothetical protein